MESLSLMQRREVALKTSIRRLDLVRSCGCSSGNSFYEYYVPGLVFVGCFIFGRG
jgi:hypothetical protein